jgi:hypothetical protein
MERGNWRMMMMVMMVMMMTIMGLSSNCAFL